MEARPDVPVDQIDFTQPYAVDAATCRSFQECGHAVVRGLARPAEVAAFRPALLEAAAAGRFEHRPLAQRDTYGRAFLQMCNLWQRSEQARAFVFAHRFAQVAADLLGVEAVRLYHDQALFKEPGGGFTPWHQDQFYWPLDTDQTITLWMPLVAVEEAMGPMVFAEGSHHRGHLGAFPIGDESHRVFEEKIRSEGFSRGGARRFDPGDASFHSGWVLHSASGNQTEKMREVLTVIYFADGAKVTPLDHPNRQFDRDLWLPGCEPGTPAASPLNPVL